MIDCDYTYFVNMAVINIKNKHDPDILALSLDFQCDGWLVTFLSISWQEFELQNLGKHDRFLFLWKVCSEEKEVRILVHTWLVVTHGWDCKDEPKTIQYDEWQSHG